MTHRSRPAARAPSYRRRGFTLVELAVTITLAAIVAVIIVPFLTVPVDSYFAQSRRAELVDSADHVMRSVGDDVRLALPNSARQTLAAGVWALELLRTSGVAQYYGPGNRGNPAEELTPGTQDNSFYTIDQFASLNGQYLAVNNQGVPGAYALTGIMAPLPPPPAIVLNPMTMEAQVTLGGGGFNFTPPGSTTHNIFVVSYPVSYICDTSAGTLRRYSNYNVAASQPTSAPAGALNSLIAQHVSTCNFRVVPAPALGNFGQLAIVEITLANSGETLQVFQEASPSYLP
jgi:MSHA biogenesis protein MshO